MQDLWIEIRRNIPLQSVAMAVIGVCHGKIHVCLLDAYGNGIRNFISGFAIGFDMMAAEWRWLMR